MSQSAVAWIAAAGFALWAIYSLATLATTGEVWIPVSRHASGTSMWRQATDVPFQTSVMMAIYAGAALFFALLANRRRRR